MANALFGVGQLIRHRLFNYRGVIIDVDPVYSGSEEWYEQMARTRPPRFKPWYHVLVHDAVHRTYVAERNLKADDSPEPVNHPELDEFFSEFVDGRYKPRLRGN